MFCPMAPPERLFWVLFLCEEPGSISGNHALLEEGMGSLPPGDFREAVERRTCAVGYSSE